MRNRLLLSQIAAVVALAGVFSPALHAQSASSFGGARLPNERSDAHTDPAPTPDLRTPDARPGSQNVSNTVAFTNSMEVLNGDTKLGKGDTLSYRVVEERTPPIPMTVTDSGEVEVPFIGRVQASGKSCKQLAYEIKPLLEREYFYKATVVIGLSTLSTRSRGKVYLMGQVRTQGAMEIPPDETLTVSKAILRAGGVMDFANRTKVKLVRKKPDGKSETTFVNLVDILDKGHIEKDPEIGPDDLIIVPERLINF